MFFSITEGCELVDEAAMFIDFMTNSVEANDILLGERGVPVSNLIREDLQAKVDPVSEQVFAYIASLADIVQPVPPPDPAGWNDIRVNVLAPQFTDPVLFGMISAQEGYDAFVTESNAILAEAAANAE
jgi:multiple sugar transport system substrate-binding protein